MLLRYWNEDASVSAREPQCFTCLGLLKLDFVKPWWALHEGLYQSKTGQR